jgi:hypothetical protein
MDVDRARVWICPGIRGEFQVSDAIKLILSLALLGLVVAVGARVTGKLTNGVL